MSITEEELARIEGRLGNYSCSAETDGKILIAALREAWAEVEKLQADTRLLDAAFEQRDAAEAERDALRAAIERKDELARSALRLFDAALRSSEKETK